MKTLKLRPKETIHGEMRYRVLGRTAEQVSVIGLGGHHIGRQKHEKDSIRIIRAAIDAGINFMDNCWDYHNGVSEIRMGKALKDGYRNRVFLMTKIDGRTREEATRQIHQSLQRLQTDTIDLLQHHEVLRMEDPNRIFARGGAMEAVLAAQKAGKVRFIGFTGHKDPLVHLRMLEVAAQHKFRFDTVQMPLNVMQFWPTRPACAGARRHWRVRHEADGRRPHSQEQDSDSRRVPPLRDELAHSNRHHRHRQPQNPQAGPGSGMHVSATFQEAGLGALGAHRDGRVHRSVRRIQDNQRVRRHGQEPGVVGESGTRPRLRVMAGRIEFF